MYHRQCGTESQTSYSISYDRRSLITKKKMLSIRWKKYSTANNRTEKLWLCKFFIRFVCFVQCLIQCTIDVISCEFWFSIDNFDAEIEQTNVQLVLHSAYYYCDRFFFLLHICYIFHMCSIWIKYAGREQMFQMHRNLYFCFICKWK